MDWTAPVRRAERPAIPRRCLFAARQPGLDDDVRSGFRAEFEAPDRGHRAA